MSPRTSTARRTAIVVAVAAVAAFGTLAASCSSDDSSSGKTTTTEKSKSNDSKKNFSVSTPAGEVSLSIDGELPPGWPSGFPVPKGADVAGSGSVAKSDSGVMVGVYTTKQSGKDTFDYYTGQSSL